MDALEYARRFPEHWRQGQEIVVALDAQTADFSVSVLPNGRHLLIRLGTQDQWVWSDSEWVDNGARVDEFVALCQ